VGGVLYKQAPLSVDNLESAIKNLHYYMSVMEARNCSTTPCDDCSMYLDIASNYVRKLEFFANNNPSESDKARLAELNVVDIKHELNALALLRLTRTSYNQRNHDKKEKARSSQRKLLTSFQ